MGIGGVIKDLGVEDANVIGQDVIGGLVAKNEGGTVSRCYSTGNVDGFSYTGGLIGSNEDAAVEKCYSDNSQFIGRK